MSNRPKRLPNYFLDAWEQTMYCLKYIDDAARQASETAIKAGHPEYAQIANDIRTRAIDAKSLMNQARTGDYEI